MALQVPITAKNPQKSFCPLRNVSATIRNWKFTPFCAIKPALKIARATLSNKESSIVRPSVNFPPSIWGDRFISMPLNESKFKSNSVKVEVLREEVKHMLMTCGSTDPVEKINLIDTLWCLGVSYHFENEIDDYLNEIFYTQPCLLDTKEYDLYNVALVFRVFRQHGYNVSCDVFQKFKDSDGQFKESLISDTKGMLSLYEAAYLCTPGEEILHEALTFTKDHLQTLAAQSDTHLASQIINALKHPLHRTVPRLVARKCIDFYEKDECQNETVLNFAKLDYDRVQFLHRQELREILTWWKETKIPQELYFTRDRMVEVYFWMMALRSEPNYARSRKTDTKFTHLFSTVDDIFDAYGNREELQSFTEAIQRWDYGCLDQLPDYMKILYRTILETFSEYEKEVTSKLEDRSRGIYCAKDGAKQLVRAYQKEIDWLHEGYVPSLDERLSYAEITSGVRLTTGVFFLGMGLIAGIQEFEWLESNPRIVSLVAIICRLINDIASHKHEQDRKHDPSSIECYMKQHGVSEMEAIEELRKMIENGWEEINQECMRPTDISLKLINPVVNFLRLVHFIYTNADGYTNPEYLKDTIEALFVYPIFV